MAALLEGENDIDVYYNIVTDIPNEFFSETFYNGVSLENQFNLLLSYVGNYPEEFENKINKLIGDVRLRDLKKLVVPDFVEFINEFTFTNQIVPKLKKPKFEKHIIKPEFSNICHKEKHYTKFGYNEGFPIQYDNFGNYLKEKYDLLKLPTFTKYSNIKRFVWVLLYRSGAFEQFNDLANDLIDSIGTKNILNENVPNLSLELQNLLLSLKSENSLELRDEMFPLEFGISIRAPVVDSLCATQPQEAYQRIFNSYEAITNNTINSIFKIDACPNVVSTVLTLFNTYGGFKISLDEKKITCEKIDEEIVESEYLYFEKLMEIVSFNSNFELFKNILFWITLNENDILALTNIIYYSKNFKQITVACELFNQHICECYDTKAMYSMLSVVTMDSPEYSHKSLNTILNVIFDNNNESICTRNAHSAISLKIYQDISIFELMVYFSKHLKKSSDYSNLSHFYALLMYSTSIPISLKQIVAHYYKGYETPNYRDSNTIKFVVPENFEESLISPIDEYYKLKEKNYDVCKILDSVKEYANYSKIEFYDNTECANEMILIS